MKTKTRDYRFAVKLLVKEHVFSKKYCKTIASRLVANSASFKILKLHFRHQYSITYLMERMHIWHVSPEGYNYWYRIHCKLNKGINIRGEYIGTSDKEIDESLLIPF